MGKQHIIELNGQRYDALTGKIITPEPIATPKTTVKQSPRNMDFVKVPKNHLTHHKTQKPSTLMRSTVTSPAPAVQKPTPQLTKQNISRHETLKPKSVGNHKRSTLVSHFGSTNKPAAATHPHKPSATKTSVQSAPATKQIHSFASNIDNATSHELPKLKKPSIHRRIAKKLHISPGLVSSSAFAISFLIIGGLVAYQNVPGLTMKLASSRSGVNGNLPAYKPSGFGLNGSVAYKPGQITINYKSNSDERNFKIIQSNSEWNSEALQENYLKEEESVQVAQNKGKTVYIYNDYNATWVDGGVWYRIEGDSKLNSDQLQKIVGSL